MPHLYRASHLLTSCLQIFDHLNHFQPPPEQLWLTWGPQTCSRRQTCPASFSPQSSKLRGFEPSPGLILRLNCIFDVTYFICSDSTEKPSEALLLFKGSCCLCECDHLVNLNLRNHRLQAFLQWFHQLILKPKNENHAVPRIRSPTNFCLKLDLLWTPPASSCSSRSRNSSSQKETGTHTKQLEAGEGRHLRCANIVWASSV